MGPLASAGWWPWRRAWTGARSSALADPPRRCDQLMPRPHGATSSTFLAAGSSRQACRLSARGCSGRSGPVFDRRGQCRFGFARSSSVCSWSRFRDRGVRSRHQSRRPRLRRPGRVESASCRPGCRCRRCRNRWPRPCEGSAAAGSDAGRSSVGKLQQMCRPDRSATGTEEHHMIGCGFAVVDGQNRSEEVACTASGLACGSRSGELCRCRLLRRSGCASLIVLWERVLGRRERIGGHG